ncbi:MAG: transposase [Flavobacteriales bacterium]|nr:transposase [Flavobacteriales bacterium]
MEATGHYTLMMLNLIVGQQWHAWLAHPNDIQQSMGIKRVKNDKVDALRIAQYARTFHEKARLFTAQNLKLDRLKHLITRRNHLVRSRARHRTHITDLNRYMDRQLRTEFDRIDKRQIKLEDQLVAHVDALILAEIRTDPQTERQYDLLRTIPGVGPHLPHTWWPAPMALHASTRRASSRAMPVSHPSSAAQAAACVAAPKCRIKLISRSRPCCTCPRW